MSDAAALPLILVSQDHPNSVTDMVLTKNVTPNLFLRDRFDELYAKAHTNHHLPHADWTLYLVGPPEMLWHHGFGILLVQRSGTHSLFSLQLTVVANWLLCVSATCLHTSGICTLNSAVAIQSSVLAVLAVRQLNIYCSPAPSMGYSEWESGQTTLL